MHDTWVWMQRRVKEHPRETLPCLSIHNEVRSGCVFRVGMDDIQWVSSDINHYLFFDIFYIKEHTVPYYYRSVSMWSICRL